MNLFTKKTVLAVATLLIGFSATIGSAANVSMPAEKAAVVGEEPVLQPNGFFPGVRDWGCRWGVFYQFC